MFLICIFDIWSVSHTRRIYRRDVNLILFRHCPSKIFWNCTIWNINIQYKNDWYTLKKITKLVFAFRHWDNLVSSSLLISFLISYNRKVVNDLGHLVSLHFYMDIKYTSPIKGFYIWLFECWDCILILQAWNPIKCEDTKECEAEIKSS